MLVHAWSDGSVKESGVWLEWTNGETEELRVPAGVFGSSFSEEVAALAAAVAHLVPRLAGQQGHVAFYTDSLSLLQQLQSAAGPDDSAGVTDIRRSLMCLSKSLTSHLIWVPGHAGIDGNERADALAKAASDLEQQQVAIPFATTKAVLSKHFISRWHSGIRRDAHFEVTGGRTPHWPPGLSREEQRINSQLRTGHSSLTGAYLARIGKRNTPACERCQHQLDDCRHLIIDCPQLDGHRHKILGALPALQILMSEPEKVVHFLRVAGLIG